MPLPKVEKFDKMRSGEEIKERLKKRGRLDRVKQGKYKMDT
jgi:predicted transcriptional regulator of viral defense system